jgi:hypothetical protein
MPSLVSERMPVVSLELPLQPAVLVAGGATGVEEVDPNAGVDVGVLVALEPPPQAASEVKSSATHTFLITSPCLVKVSAYARAHRARREPSGTRIGCSRRTALLRHAQALGRVSDRMRPAEEQADQSKPRCIESFLARSESEGPARTGAWSPRVALDSNGRDRERPLCFSPTANMFSIKKHRRAMSQIPDSDKG